MYETGTIITLQAGAYRLREPIATSSYGEVWRADGPAAIGAVALKLVNRARMARAGGSQRARWADCARAELGVLGTLQPWDQRHVVRLLDHGTHERLPVLALELMDGDLRATPAPSVARALEWIGQANQALAKIHQHGWRYLDLKPGNLLLDRDGNLKLCDFGTVRQLADAAPHEFTGTPGWQAPEQAVAARDGLHDTDARTDYFALGLLFFHLVTGEQLRGAATLTAADTSRFCERLAGAAPPALALLRWLLAPERAQRPRHALDISRALARIHAAMPAPVLRSAA